MYNDYSSLSNSTGVLALFAGMLFVVAVVLVLCYLLTIYPIYKMSIKANLKRPKLAFVPFINFANVYNLANLSFWFCLISFIPYVGAIAAMILAAYINFKVAENFGLSTLGCIATIFFPLIAYWYIALADKDFVGTLNPKYISEETTATINNCKYNY